MWLVRRADGLWRAGVVGRGLAIVLVLVTRPHGTGRGRYDQASRKANTISAELSAAICV